MAKLGRPTKITPLAVKKMEEVFAIGGSDSEACFYANISRQTFYQYLKLHPEFNDRIDALREKPILKARQTIIKNLDEPETSKWYLERKKKSEFSTRTELTGQDGEKLIPIYGGESVIQEYNGNQKDIPTKKED